MDKIQLNKKKDFLFFAVILAVIVATAVGISIWLSSIDISGIEIIGTPDEMFSIGNDMLSFILSQVFGAIAFVCVFINFIVNGKKNILFWHVIGSLFWMLMFVFAGNLVGIVLAGLGVVRSGMFLICELKPGRKWKIGGKVTLYTAILIGFLLFSLGFFGALGPYAQALAHWWDWIVVFTSVLFVVGTYMKSKHIVRLGTVVYAATLLTQLILRTVLFGEIFNIAAIAIEVSKILSVVVFYTILMKRKGEAKEKKLVFAYPFRSEGIEEFEETEESGAKAAEEAEKK